MKQYLFNYNDLKKAQNALHVTDFESDIHFKRLYVVEDNTSILISTFQI